MIGLALLMPLVAAATSQAEMPELDLLRVATHAAIYASYQYECQGYSAWEARKRAKVALGRNFDDRYHAVLAKMSMKYGDEAVGQASLVLPVGYKLGRETCRRFESNVRRARSALTELEARNGE